MTNDDEDAEDQDGDEDLVAENGREQFAQGDELLSQDDGHEEQGSEQFKGIVVVETIDGRRFEEIEEHNRGSAANPMTGAEIEGKFRENVAGTLTDEQATRLIETVERIETLDDVSAVTALAVA